MNAAIVVNPAAGNGRAGRRWSELAAQLKAQGIAGEVFFTSRPGDATVLARQALEAGRDTVIAVGGDGTINEVVNGFFLAGVPINPSARLGIVCYGTGADFVKSIGLPAGAAAIPHLAVGHTVALDVGLASFRDLVGRPAARYFLNFTDLGLGGETVARVNRTTKAFGGFVSFLWGALLAILAYRGKAAEIILDDDEPVREVVGDLVVANGQWFGGGMHVAPMADPTDGLFDVLVLGDVPKPELIFRLLPRVYRGTHLGHRSVWWRRARRVIVRSPDRMLLDIDGELGGMTDAEFRLLPGALLVIVPRGFPGAR
jgi:YegS/Rv2252/BmrU family lipid kinase